MNSSPEHWRRGVRVNRWFESLTPDQKKLALALANDKGISTSGAWNSFTLKQKEEAMRLAIKTYGKDGTFGIDSTCMVGDIVVKNKFRSDYYHPAGKYTRKKLKK